MLVDFHKQDELFNPTEHKTRINIIGAGSVGSFIALELSKMGMFQIEIWDKDTIEPHNLPNQFFKQSDRGRPKVEALKELIKEFNGEEIKTHNKFITEDTEFEPYGIVICSVDSMEARKTIWNKVKNNIHINAFVDTRMGGEAMKILTIKPYNRKHQKIYEDSLFEDFKAEEGRCSVQTIIYNVLTIAGLVGCQVKKILKSEKFQEEIYFDMGNMCFINMRR